MKLFLYIVGGVLFVIIYIVALSLVLIGRKKPPKPWDNKIEKEEKE